MIADLRDAREAGEHETGKRLEILVAAHVLALQQPLRLVDAEHAVHQPRAVVAAHGRRPPRCRSHVLGQLAGDRRQDVGRRHDPFDDAVFVDHHRHVDRVLAEHLEQAEHRRRLVHDERLA